MTSLPSGGTGTGLHDVYNARAFRANCGSQFRYVPERGKWVEWNGTVWRELCDTGPVEEAAEQIIETHVIRGDKAGEAHSRRSLSERGIRAAVRLASNYADMRVAADQFDRQPFELNTPDGMIDLIDGKLKAAKPEHWHTKMTGVSFDPAADCTRWKAFLKTTFEGNAELIDYMQRLIGYAATGKVTEHILPFWHGGGQNGKSVLSEVIQRVLGDYAITAPKDFLLAGRDQHPTEVARLKGARFVMCSEINQGSRFDEAKVKLLTGGDQLTARFMHRDYFQFTPTHTLFLMANHQPSVQAGGNAFWRRLRLIPFAHQVPEDERNPKLAEELVDAEGPAILAWTVAGAVTVASDGLREPSEVLAATQEYAESEDTIGQFIAECFIEAHPDIKIASGDVYRRYGQWCSENGEEVKKRNVFGRELSSRGHQAKKSTNGKRFIFGIALDRPLDNGYMP